MSAIFNLCVCWSFPPLQLVASLLQSHPFRCCSNECRGDVVSLLLYRGRLPVGATVFLLRSAVTTVVFEQTRFLAGSGRNSMRWQQCLMEEAGDRLWKVRYVCRTSFSVKSWPKLDLWVVFGGGEKMCWCTVSSCRMFSSHPKWHLNTFDDSIPKGTFCTGWAECPLDSRFFSLRKLTIHRNIEEWRGRNLEC